METTKTRKLVAEAAEGHQSSWKIYDDFKIEGPWISSYGDKFLSYLKRLEPGKQYLFLNWGENREFEECFKTVYTNNIRDYGGVLINFYGFEPVKCKECGFETETKVCANCGEWQ